MKRILIWELKSPIGGVENVIMNYLRHFDRGEIVPDIMFKGDAFQYENEIEEMGGKVFYMPSYLPNVWKYRKKLDSVFTNTSYDAVWCNFSGLTNVDVLKKAKEYNVPVRIAHSHVTKLSWSSTFAKYIVIPLHYLNKSRVCKYATNYWCCSYSAGKFMFPKIVWDRLVYVKNAIDLDKYGFDFNIRSAVRGMYGINDELVIGHIGRYTIAKNQKFLLDIFKEILAIIPNSKLLLVAEGELEDEIKSYAKELDVEESIIFAGRIDDVATYYSAMDVFLLPSLFEGLGMTLIEAQMAGTPCLASTNVPNEAKVTEGVKFLNLELGASEWAKEAINLSKSRINNPKDDVILAGYDISNEAIIVQGFFER